MCDIEIEAEVEAIKRVTETVCPLKIVLDRVVLTSTGVLLGLWQVWIFKTPCAVSELTTWTSVFPCFVTSSNNLSLQSSIMRCIQTEI